MSDRFQYEREWQEHLFEQVVDILPLLSLHFHIVLTAGAREFLKGAGVRIEGR